eukprot:maker-scaffold714_size108203-snap-gene-0.21 protein:Tk02390 transcript:maker-scaffold714_size108203-snap-gene-0.21-mRNA-1 annotation:"echotoxin a"
MTELERSGLQEKYKSSSVAFAIRIQNATQLNLKHIESYIHYGNLDLEILHNRNVAKQSESVFVGRNTFGTPTGSSGLHLWQIGDTHYHLVIGWSGPRNFYTHSNTLMFGITNGNPVQIEEGGFARLFNKMYNADDVSSFVKVICDYHQGSREGHLITNKFSVGGEVEQEHKSWNTICFRTQKDLAPDEMNKWMYTEKAGIKLISHRRAGTSSMISNLDEEQNHLALVIEFRHKKSVRDDSVWICELSGLLQSKSDIRLSDRSRPRCQLVPKSDLIKSRNGLHMRVYNLGEIRTSTTDLEYFSQKVETRTNLALGERCCFWIQELASWLNAPHQEVIRQALEIAVEADEAFNVLGGNSGLDVMPAPTNLMDSLRFFSPTTLLSHEKLKSLTSQL